MPLAQEPAPSSYVKIDFLSTRGTILDGPSGSIRTYLTGELKDWTNFLMTIYYNKLSYEWSGDPTTLPKVTTAKCR